MFHQPWRGRGVKETFFPALNSRPFAVLWGAESASTLFVYASSAAKSLLLYGLTRSLLIVGLGAVMFPTARVLFGLYGGLLAQQRQHRDKVIAITFLAWAANDFWLMGTLLYGAGQWWCVLLSSWLEGTIVAVQNPSIRARLNELAPEAHLQNASTLRDLSTPAGNLVGAAVAWVILPHSTVLTDGVILCLALNMFSSLFVPVAFPMIDAHAAGRESTPVALGLRDAIAHVLDNHQVWMTLAGVAAMFLLLNQTVIILRLNPNPGAFTVLTLVFVAGSVCGAAFVLPRSRRGFRHEHVFAAVIVGLAELLIAQTDLFWLQLAGLVAVGFGVAVFTAATTALLYQVDAARTGLMAALYSIVLSGAVALGSPLAGWLAGRSAAGLLRFAALGALSAGVLLAVASRPRFSIPRERIAEDELSPRVRGLLEHVRDLADRDVPGVIVWAGPVDAAITEFEAAAATESRLFPELHNSQMFLVCRRAQIPEAAAALRINQRRARARQPFVTHWRAWSTYDFVVALDSRIKLLITSASNTEDARLLFAALGRGSEVVFLDTSPGQELPAAMHELLAGLPLEWKSLTARDEADQAQSPATGDEPGASFLVTAELQPPLSSRAHRALDEERWRRAVFEALLRLEDPTGKGLDRQAVFSWDISTRARKADPTLEQAEVIPTLDRLVADGDVLPSSQPVYSSWHDPAYTTTTLGRAHHMGEQPRLNTSPQVAAHSRTQWLRALRALRQPRRLANAAVYVTGRRKRAQRARTRAP